MVCHMHRLPCRSTASVAMELRIKSAHIDRHTSSDSAAVELKKIRSIRLMPLPRALHRIPGIDPAWRASHSHIWGKDLDSNAFASIGACAKDRSKEAVAGRLGR